VKDGHRLNCKFYRITLSNEASLKPTIAQEVLQPCSAFLESKEKKNSMKPYIMNDVIGLSA